MPDAEIYSWMTWAHAQQNLNPTQSLVIHELARLSDARGRAVATINHLVNVTGRGRRSVFRAVADLEHQGLVSRIPRRVDGRQAATCYQLCASAVDRSATSGDSLNEPPIHLVHMAPTATGATPLHPSDSEGLRQCLTRCRDLAWTGPATHQLASTIIEHGPRQFNVAVAASYRIDHLTRDHALADTLSLAWEMARTYTDRIIAAQRPWAMWTTMVRRKRLELLENKPEAGLSLIDPTLFAGVVEPAMSTTAALPGHGPATTMAVELEDFQGIIHTLIYALIDAGMPETIAWTGTKRIIELSLSDHSRRHVKAATDPRLADLGIPPACARAWMTLLTGSRRGADKSLIETDPTDINIQAGRLVAMMKIAA